MNFALSGNVKVIDTSLEEIAERWKIQYFSPYRILCNADGCLTMLGDDPSTLTAWDGAHLTDAGSNCVVSHFNDASLH